MSSPSRRPAAIALGCEGTALTAAEKTFFADANPFGLILFARNIGAPEAVKRLVSDFRAVVDRPDAPVFIDQEGGRVARLKPPHWPALPPPGRIGALALRDLGRAETAATLLGRAIGATIQPLGIDVACAPMADVAAPDANAQVIGDRAFGSAPDIVAALAAAEDGALRAAGVATTAKHAPGHGRARVDSHHELPRVAAAEPELRADLAPFKALTAAPFWMTAHIVYEALDPTLPATCSKICLDWLRAETGYDGLILSDDLAMHALPNDPEANAAKARAAGCDLLLYCPGDLSGGAAAVAGAGPAGDRLLSQWARWTACRPATAPMDAFKLAARLWAMLDDIGQPAV